MSLRCLDCHKSVPTDKRERRRAAKKPVNWCTCGLRVQQRAKDYPRLFASGYDNTNAWRQAYAQYIDTDTDP